MTFYAEYPQQRFAVEATTVRREVLLPDGVNGTLLVQDGNRVEIITPVARGQLPSRHHLVEAAQELRLRNPDDLNALLLVAVGETVEAGQALAGRNANRGRRAKSPVDGIVAGVDAGRIIVREAPEEIDLEAGMQGFVVGVRPRRGVLIQASGGVMQGVWGNNRRAIGALRFEPEDGLELIQGDDLSFGWNGSIVVTRRPLSHLGLQVMEAQDIVGVIAPSMDSTLIDVARNINRAILLTEGFGSMRMSVITLNYLTEMIENNVNVRGTLDAVTPTAHVARRPELLINIPYREGKQPRPPRTPDRFEVGMNVRVTTSPYSGQAGVIEALPEGLLPLAGGMRVPAAQVKLTGGEIVTVPFANLELFAG